MPDVMMGQRVKELVRRYFMEGKKSSNKLYATDTGGKAVPDTAKAKKRKADQDLAEYYLPQIQEGFKGASLDGIGKQLLDPELRAADVLSGNCGEMSVVAEYLVRHHEHVPANQIYHCSISKPGDHSFCLVSDSVIPAGEREHGTLYGFLKNNPNHLIIDPWLNTACLCSEYIRQSGDRLSKWQLSGKRVAWSGPDGKKKGWYPPAGEYKQAMQRSPVTLRPYG